MMSKNKIIGAISVVAVIFFAAMGVWYFRTQDKPKNTRTARVNSVPGGGQTLAETSDPNSIPLNRTQPANSSSGGLSVAPGSSANNLGQITPNGDGSNNTSAPKSSAPKGLDPATFGEYDKYKDGESALFGDMQAGTGAELTNGKKAAVYYKGWLTNGQLFDQSRPDKDGKLEPFVFEMGARQVIPGWEQALGGMKVGGTRLVIVPPAVGYGAAGQSGIPGNSVLVFQVQLLAVQ